MKFPNEIWSYKNVRERKFPGSFLKEGKIRKKEKLAGKWGARISLLACQSFAKLLL